MIKTCTEAYKPIQKTADKVRVILFWLFLPIIIPPMCLVLCCGMAWVVVSTIWEYWREKKKFS